MQSVLGNVGLGPSKVAPENLNGRIAVVTGGAYGIGYEISRALVHAGCKVIMVNRLEEHGQAALETLRGETPGADIEWKSCDMGVLAQVRDVFGALRESLERLDFLVLDAGINSSPYGLDADGIEHHFGVNYLSHYYVCNQLWPVLRRTSQQPEAPPPRVVFVASEMHRMAPSKVHFASLDEINDDSLTPAQLYGRTKLALILLAKYGLAGKVIKDNGDRIYTASVHPGTVDTAMQQQWEQAYSGLTGKLIKWVVLAAGRDVEQGSYSALWALTAPELEGKEMNGWYFNDPAKPGKESSQASDAVLGTALWELSERLVKDKLGENAFSDWNAI